MRSNTTMNDTEIGTPIFYIDYEGTKHNGLVTATYGSKLESKSSIGLIYVVEDAASYKVETPTSVPWQTVDTQTSCWKSTA